VHDTHAYITPFELASTSSMQTTGSGCSTIASPLVLVAIAVDPAHLSCCSGKGHMRNTSMQPRRMCRSQPYNVLCLCQSRKKVTSIRVCLIRHSAEWNVHVLLNNKNSIGRSCQKTPWKSPTGRYPPLLPLAMTLFVFGSMEIAWAIM